MNTFKNPGQVGHIEAGMVAIAAADFVGCSALLTGEIRGAKRIVVISGRTDERTAVLARQDTGEDMHVPLMVAVYVDFSSAASAYTTRANEIYQYASEARERNELRRCDDLRKLANLLREKASEYRRVAAAS